MHGDGAGGAQWGLQKHREGAPSQHLGWDSPPGSDVAEAALYSEGYRGTSQ